MNRSIIFGAIIISAAILLNGYFDRAIRAPHSARSSEKSAASIRDKSIAVLPFQDSSSSQQNTDLANGVQEEITTELAKVHELKVTPSGDVMQYKSSASRNVHDIGHRLGVAHILEGSVGRSGDRVRVSVQLIDATTDERLWAEAFDRELTDLFAIESEIAKSVAEQLGAKLSTAERMAIETQRPSQ